MIFVNKLYNFFYMQIIIHKYRFLIADLLTKIFNFCKLFGANNSTCKYNKFFFGLFLELKYHYENGAIHFGLDQVLNRYTY